MASLFRKASQQEFQHQIKEIRVQLVDQVKCLEQRTDVQVAILGEINDFVRKKAELDLDYSKQVDKLVKSVMMKHKNEKMKRANWALHSTCQLWQQLVDDAKEEARQRSIAADVCANYVCPAIAQRTMALQKIAKKCREIGVLAQSEVVRVLHELHTAMKTYQHCFFQFNALSGQLQQAEVQRNKVGPNSSTRKQRSVQKTFDKKSEKYASAQLKCTRARNEYLLCIDAANASLHKFFADDISDLIDCTDLGMDWWLSLVLHNMITARKSACQVEMNALANLGTFKESLQSAADKQRFFESNHQAFMLPKRFDFKCDEAEHVEQISVAEGSLADEFRQRHHQIRKRLATLRAESEMSWQNMEGTERQIRDLLGTSTIVQVSEFGIAADDDRRLCCENAEAELVKAYDAYMQTFSYYLYTANLIMRLEARADGIGNALCIVPPPSSSVLDTDQPQHSSPSRLTVCGTSICSATVGQFSESSTKNGMVGPMSVTSSIHKSDPMVADLSERSDSLEWAQRCRKKRIGSQASTELVHVSSASAFGGGASSSSGGAGGTGVTAAANAHMWRRPRLFGGGLEEYTELTGEPIPLVVVSCIRILSQHALHHQGLFRISGSQSEINHMREAFESGDDPLRDVHDANDANSIAGLLKLYLRELREPLFPFYLFDLLTDCAKCASTDDFIAKVCPLLNKLPRATYLLLRYLFAFLNHLSELCDENMMDPYNLAICFGPTLLPIPEGKDQVHYQNSVNEVVKNLIVHSDGVFTARVPGPRYEKYAAIESTDGGDGTPAGDISAELELFVDDEVSSAAATAPLTQPNAHAQLTPMDNWPSSSSTLQRNSHSKQQQQQQLQQQRKRLSSADLPFPPPSPQFHRFHSQLQQPSSSSSSMLPLSSSSASSPQQQQHHQQQQQQQRLPPFVANNHHHHQQQRSITDNNNPQHHQQKGGMTTTAMAQRMDWSMCSGGGGDTTATTASSSANQNHQPKFLASSNNGNNNNTNNINNNYCYSSSESGIADPTATAPNGISAAVVISPRLVVQQQQQQQMGGSSGAMDNLSAMYASIHKGDPHQQHRQLGGGGGGQVTSPLMATTTTAPVSATQQQQQSQRRQLSSQAGTTTAPTKVEPNAQQQQNLHRSPPPVVVRLGSSNNNTSSNNTPHQHVQAVAGGGGAQQQQRQLQQQSRGNSPPPYNALYGSRMLLASTTTAPTTTTSGGGGSTAAQLPHAPPQQVGVNRVSRMVSPLSSATKTAASIYPSPTRRRNSFHDNVNSSMMCSGSSSTAAIAATCVSVMPSAHAQLLHYHHHRPSVAAALDKLPPVSTSTAEPSSSSPCKPKSTTTDQLKQQRQHQINAIDDLLGKLSGTAIGSASGGGDDQKTQPKTT